MAALFWWVLDWDWLGYAAFALSFGIAAFFRDPVRTTPVGQGLIVAPADGLVTMITNVPPPPELWGEGGLSEEPVVRVSIFMSVFDVHINRTPVTGTILKVVYIAGKFPHSDLDKRARHCGQHYGRGRGRHPLVFTPDRRLWRGVVPGSSRDRVRRSASV